MKLTQIYHQILQEIGEGSSKPFEYTIKREGPPTQYVIDGETSKGEKEPINLFLMYAKFSEFKIEYLLDHPEEEIGYDQEFVDLVKNYKEKFTEGLNMMTVIFDRARNDGKGFDDVNDTQFMFRLMATLKEILMGVIKQKNINVIDFNPSESSSKGDFGVGRHRLYKLFIKKAFPNAIEVVDNKYEVPRVFFILN
jgi:hypothetical protein